MISIVIATHGDPRLLDLTLEAAAQATTTDVEYVLVGDVETAIARRAGQPLGSRLITVHRPDLGRVAALNEGGYEDKVRVVRVNDWTTQWTYADVVEVVEGAGATSAA